MCFKNKLTLKYCLYTSKSAHAAPLDPLKTRDCQSPHISELESYYKPTIWKTSASALYYYHNQFMRMFSHHVGQASVSLGAETK